MESCIEVVLAAILALNPNWSEEKALKFANPICNQSEKYDVDPLIAVSIAKHETNFNHKLKYKNRNGSTDFGLMQFNCKKDLSKITLSWRKWWCQPKRRKYLMSIEGNIKAGFREIKFWKDVCYRKHGDQFLFFRSKDHYKDLFYKFIIIINNLYNNNKIYKDLKTNCADCRPVALIASIYKNLEENWKLIFVLKSHWWIRHYNWNSKKHWLSIMYIYKTLLERRKNNYKIITTGYYRKLGNAGLLKECIKAEDMCLGRFKKWRKRKM